jgi:hypothetical protein
MKVAPGDSGVSSRFCASDGPSRPRLGERAVVLLPASPSASDNQYRHQYPDQYADRDRRGHVATQWRCLYRFLFVRRELLMRLDP